MNVEPLTGAYTVGHKSKTSKSVFGVIWLQIWLFLIRMIPFHFEMLIGNDTFPALIVYEVYTYCYLLDLEHFWFNGSARLLTNAKVSL